MFVEVVEEDNMEVRAAIKDALDRVNKRFLIWRFKQVIKQKKLSKGFPCEKIETEASSFDVVQISLNSTNSRVVSKAAHVRKFLLLPTDFSMAGGELTPTLKVFFLQIIKRVLDEQKTLQERLWNPNGKLCILFGYYIRILLHQ